MNQEEKKIAALNFQKELEAFTNHVCNLQENGALSSEKDFLNQLAKDVSNLYSYSIQMQKTAVEDLEEIGAVIQYIFVQPLSLKNRQSMNMLKAVETYDPSKGNACDLSSIMQEYVIHPASTKSFIIELKLLKNELDNALRQIA